MRRNHLNKENCDLTILMPCLNEAETLVSCIERGKKFLKESRINGEIVVADNGSTDGSQNLALLNGARITQIKHKGYGAASLGGIDSAVGKFIIMGDADGSCDFGAISPFLDDLKSGRDLVVGNRFLGGIKPGAMPILHKYFGNPLISGIGRLLFRVPIGDYNCGFRGFRRESILKLNLQTTGMEFASEMIVKAKLAGLEISEVPVILYPDGRTRPSHVKRWRDGWRHLRFMLLFSPRWLFLFPGLILCLFGILFGSWILLSQEFLFNFILDMGILLICMIGVFMGFQSILFAVLTKIYAINNGMMPEDVRLNKALNYVSLESGLLTGSFLLFVGLIGLFTTLYNLLHGLNQNFESISFMRWLIPFTLAIVLGFQIVLFSFFLSILGLKERPFIPVDDKKKTK